MKEIFDRYIEHSMQSGFEKFKLIQFESNYRKYFPEAGRETLDIGVGQGEMLTCMRDWGYKYMGVDISGSTVAACQARGLNCAVVPDTGAFLRENASRFSVITLLDVLEHIPRDSMIGLLGDMRVALAPGGRAIIQAPNAQSLESYLHRHNDITHETSFSEHSLGQVLLAAGFEEFNFFGYETFPQRSAKVAVKRMLRSAIWKGVRFQRRMTGNLDPDVLAPVLVAVTGARTI